MKLKILPVVLILCLCACGAYAETGLRIAAASDLHMQEPKEDRVEANPLMYYQKEILGAFAADVSETGVDMLILTGDITNHGRREQHELMLDLVREIKAAGTNVYVLPGNHDIGEVTPELFAEIYADFGYADAYSRDDHSLSYSLLIKNHMILMLDTGGYTGNRMTAYLKEPTLKWMERQLSVAQKYGYTVLVFGHYPLITEQITPFEGKEEALRILHEYGADLYVCGHMHLRGVESEQGITELVLDQIVSYPCAYGLLTLEEGRKEYIPRKVSVSKWAAANGVTDPGILSFDELQIELTDNTLDLTIDALTDDCEISEPEKEQMREVFRLFRYALADGTLYQCRDSLKYHPGYGVFMKYAGDTSYGRWIPSVLTSITPYTNGFMIENGRIRAGEHE